MRLSGFRFATAFAPAATTSFVVSLRYRTGTFRLECMRAIAFGVSFLIVTNLLRLVRC